MLFCLSGLVMLILKLHQPQHMPVNAMGFLGLARVLTGMRNLFALSQDMVFNPKKQKMLLHYRQVY